MSVRASMRGREGLIKSELFLLVIAMISEYNRYQRNRGMCLCDHNGGNGD